MSLITDTLNKMKKEPDGNDNDKMMVPPALRNAVVDAKKYKDFIKNAEIKDINGHKAPLKGFVVVSIILVTVIGVATFFYLKKESSIVNKQTGIVASIAENDSNQTAQMGQNEQAGQNSQNNQIDSNQQNTNNNTQKQNISIIPESGGTMSQTATNNNNQVASKQGATKQNNLKQDNLQQGPVNIIPANQLFVISHDSVTTTEDLSNKNINNEVLKDNSKNQKQESNNKLPVDNNAKMQEDYNTIKNNNINNSKVENGSSNTEKQNNTNMQGDANQQNGASSKQMSYVQNGNIVEVKAIKSKEPVGSVSASTLSLYNQYVATGNKSKSEGNYERAIEYYTNALALNKNDILSANIASMYLELKNPNMTFQVVVKNGMVDAELISALIIRMVDNKYYLESKKLLQYANTLDKSSYTLFANGYYQQSQKKYDDAIKYYKDSMQSNSADISSAYYAALCYEEQGKNKEATDMYKYILNNGASPTNMKNIAQNKIKKLGAN